MNNENNNDKNSAIKFKRGEAKDRREITICSNTKQKEDTCEKDKHNSKTQHLPLFYGA